ncbi:MAG: MarR family winged helix-turn-helix transcriptional regulator [Rhodomicrobium sp.]
MRPLTHKIYLLGQVLSSSADRLLRARFGLGFNGYMALHALENVQQCSQAQLAGFVGITEAGISRIVTRLAGEGLLETATDPSNRRRTLLVLTPKGAELVQKASSLLEELFGRKAERAVTREDLQTFERALDAILAIMEQKQ